MKKLINNVSYYLKRHLVDAIAGVSAGNPVYALLETLVARMPDGDSINAKYNGTAASFLGVASLYSIVRDFSMRSFKITQQSKRAMIWAHDALYGAVFSFAYFFPLYGYTNVGR